MTVALRPARPLDAGTLGALITQAVAAHEWKPNLHSAAEDIAHAGTLIERGWVTVACDDTDHPLGFIAREDAYVHALFIAEGTRGRGVGRALLADAKRASARLELWTFQDNQGAQRFYERQGFEMTERTDGAGNEEGLPDVHYVWQRKARPKAPPPAPAPSEEAQP